MKNKSLFWFGIGLSPLVLGFLWLLQDKPSPIVEERKAPQRTLASLNFIPEKSSHEITDNQFLLLSSDEAQPNIYKKLSDYKGKPTIVHFWATWCEACIDEIPELDTYQELFGHNFNLVVIASDSTHGKAVREFYKSHNIKNLSVFVDENNTLARSMKVIALPTSVFISSKTKELGRIIGPVEWTGEAGKLIDNQLSKL